MRALLLVGCLTFSACVRQSTPPRSPSAATVPPSQVVLSRVVVTPEATRGLDELFAEAEAAERAGQFTQAASKFRRVFELEPRGSRAPEALFRSASNGDEAGAFDRALGDYQDFYRSFPKHERATAALVRMARLLVFREQWARAGEAADILLSRLETLTELARVATYSAKALALLAHDDDERAAYFVEKGLQVLEALNLDAAGKLPRDAAGLYFALGEVRRVRAERIHFNPVPANFGQALEQRCQLLLDAQSAYSSTMRAYDAHWSAMAGYRVGELYHSLHQELMQVPPPKAATDERRARLFEGAMRFRYSVLLQKAQAMMQHTVGMAERTGENSEWVARARAAREALLGDVKKEEAAIDRLGFTRVELQAALDRLAEKAARESPRP
ncbi:MAG: hypothetical protein SFV15_06320 [Polyangiaceae bacterium]|nr:hypothetical protein [Polyangiaceae bacterium]